ncbi:uncharacterized protein LOC116138742 [Pistacia vera]|uniref:uncharacterized protein LOC116138742 n=1 Tax=Pistacia vera TaxID=55513 RepID=UPI0012634E4D|nr:uncharacterized protein LOC116138742 [Pistacia vera]
MNPPPQPQPAPPTTTSTSGECGNCGTHIRLFLHNVRLRGIQRKLCTSCVLRLHPSSFCPICFTFYDSNPPHPSKRLSCAKCASFTHSHCAAPSSLSSPFLCPPCSDPTTFNFFKNPPAKSTNKNDMPSEDNKNVHVIDSKSGPVLLCAARIAGASMGKAVLVARIEAEKKAKEAAAARKRAREALEHVGVLISKTNNNYKDRNFDGSGSVQHSGSGNASIFNVNKKQQQSVSMSVSPKELVNNVNVNNNR